MAAAFVGVDWGTSNARFMLVDSNGQCLDTRIGPGIKRLNGAAAIENAAFTALADWPEVPVIMAGTVGATIGWRDAPYVRTPATRAIMTSHVVRFMARGRSFAILPGVDTVRDDGLPDIMRGEETQIFGALADQTAADQTAFVCLPGTHCKWAQVERGAITGFHSTMTGELIEIVGLHSIMLHPPRAPAAKPGSAFDAGVATIRDSTAGIEALLFTVRTRQVTGALSDRDADDYLAGLCIGGDVRSACALYPAMQSVTLIGSAPLTALYADALDAFGIDARAIDGQPAALAGLHAAWQALSR